MKRILFSIFLFVIPLLLWLGFEALANHFTQRFDPLKTDSHKQTFYVNPDYFKDFFLYRIENFIGLSLSNQAILQEKQQALRIFCLGGSTTAGYPYNTAPAFESKASFPNYLRLILQFNPEMASVQMLNFGCNALNSLNIRQIVQDIEAYEPDLVIIYTGHNEYFGPNEFAVSKEKTLYYQNPGFYFPFMTFKRTFLYQGMRNLIPFLVPHSESGIQDYYQWTLQNGIHPADSINQRVEHYFSDNIEQMVQYARHKKFRLVFCKPVSNLMFPPFLSLHDDKLSDRQIQLCDSLLVQGRRAMIEADKTLSFQLLQRAVDIDSRYALAQYLLGLAKVESESDQSGQKNLEMARDCDGMPFRAKSFVYRVLDRYKGDPHVTVIDLPEQLSALSDSPFPPMELFLEHVHPTQEGYYLIARILAASLLQKRFLPGITELRYPDFSECQRVLSIDPIHVAQMEEKFPQDSFFHQLALLNPEIENYMHFLRLQAQQKLARLRATADE